MTDLYIVSPGVGSDYITDNYNFYANECGYNLSKVSLTDKELVELVDTKTSETIVFKEDYILFKYRTNDLKEAIIKAATETIKNKVSFLIGDNSYISIDNVKVKLYDTINQPQIDNIDYYFRVTIEGWGVYFTVTASLDTDKGIHDNEIYFELNGTQNY